MQSLCKTGILQWTLRCSRISQLINSSSYSCTGLLTFKGSILHSKVQSHDIMKLPSINFSTSSELNGAIASVKKKLYNLMSANSKAKLGGCIAYEKCADTIDYQEFFKYFDLPDSFQSWFLIVQLHVWMCTLITITEKSGLVFRNNIVDSMWVDVETRLGHLKEVRRSSRKQFLAEISDQFRASQIAYDEGVLSNDTVLASAVWRTIFGFRNMDPRVLETMVFYIRKQIDYLDHQHTENILFKGTVEFIPLKTIIDKINAV
ncbi:unnamed protein product [Larinioides sclopetarius]|uniref:Ubiquinol-cytochrome c chaperone domain-containing protein n=1 Tax=Larinioides sclopetarius TaxID=280406 RepID=A0AAV2AZX4_9ARAC